MSAAKPSSLKPSTKVSAGPGRAPAQPLRSSIQISKRFAITAPRRTHPIGDASNVKSTELANTKSTPAAAPLNAASKPNAKVAVSSSHPMPRAVARAASGGVLSRKFVAKAAGTVLATGAAVAGRPRMIARTASSGASSRDGTDPYPDFVGTEALILKHATQIRHFEGWASTESWRSFHSSHYDWWAFPIDKPSAKAFQYTITPSVVAQLKANEQFMARFRTGVELLCRSWGWDVHTSKPIADCGDGQKWAKWPVRLYKAGRSCQVLGEDKLFSGLKAYALWLQSHHHSLEYNHSTVLELWDEPVRGSRPPASDEKKSIFGF